MAAPFEILAVEPVSVTGPHHLTDQRLMSPFVWRETVDALSMVLRVNARNSQSTGSLWYARGDGLQFEADKAPLLTPGPDDLDIRGCEDPTVVTMDAGSLVYYTGVRADGTAQLLHATGPTIHSLEKRGVAHASTVSDHNTKEAAVERLADRWLLMFEYSRQGHSRLGRADGKGPAGPWHEDRDPLVARAGCWDSNHLSTGPLLMDDASGPFMFYNGADEEDNWAIGWVQFDTECAYATRRCGAPLIAPPAMPGNDGRRISFASSLVIHERKIWLYFTVNDRSLHRATLDRTGN